jgi:hypothetical protein
MDLSPEQIKSLRRRHGKIYSTNYFGKDYVFRGFNVGEFEALTNDPSDEVQENFVREVILYPADINIDTMPAGFVTAILNEVFEVSGFADPYEANNRIDKKRQHAKAVIRMIKAFIIAAQPTHTSQSLNQLSIDELLDELALSEQVLEILSNVTNPAIESITFSIPDPVAIAEEEANRDPVKEKLLKAMESIV